MKKPVAKIASDSDEESEKPAPKKVVKPVAKVTKKVESE